MDSDTRAQAKTLFGSPTRLLLLVWAYQHDKAFFQSEPPREVGPLTQVRTELERLTALGMFSCSDNPADRRLYYERTASPLWEIVAVAARVMGFTHGDM